MAKRFGNANTSSLIRSARAAAERNAALQDQYEQYSWELSDKSPEAFQKYSAYLEKREKEAAEPGKALGFRKAQTSAYSAFRSNEIEKMNISINMGGASLYDKKSLLEKQHAEAVSIGNFDLAQRIMLQHTNLDIQIQNQEAAAAAAAMRGSGGGGWGGWGGGGGSGYAATKAIQKFYKKVDANLVDDIKGVDAAFRTGDKIELPVYDANGNQTGTKVTRVTANNRDEIKRNLMVRRAANIEAAAAELGDDDGYWQGRATDLMRAPGWDQLGADVAYEAFKKDGQKGLTNFELGVSKYAADWDVTDGATGGYKSTALRAAGPGQPVFDEQGKPVLHPITGIQLTKPNYLKGFDGDAPKIDWVFGAPGKDGADMEGNRRSGRRLQWDDNRDGESFMRNEETYLDAQQREFIMYPDKETGKMLKLYVSEKRDKNGNIITKDGQPVIDFSFKPQSWQGNVPARSGSNAQSRMGFLGEQVLKEGPEMAGQTLKGAMGAFTNPAGALNEMVKQATRLDAKQGKFDPMNIDFNPFDGDGINLNPFVSDPTMKVENKGLKLPESARAILEGANKYMGKSVAAFADPVGSVMKTFNIGREQERQAEIERMRVAAERKAQAEAAERQRLMAEAQRVSAEAARSIPKANPQQPLTYNPRTGTVGNAVGPRRPTPQLIKSYNTPGTPEFTERFLPGAAGNAAKWGAQPRKSTPAPQKKRTWNPMTWF